jgi:hypothetical protein
MTDRDTLNVITLFLLGALVMLLGILVGVVALDRGSSGQPSPTATRPTGPPTTLPQPKGRTEGIIYVDVDANQTPGPPASEPRISGATVKLTGPTTGQMTTGGDGQYEFDDLTAGTYQTSVELANGSKLPTKQWTSSMVAPNATWVVVNHFEVTPTPGP